MLGIWAQAYNLTDVIVNHADNFAGSVLAVLEAVLAETGIRLWLVVVDMTSSLLPYIEVRALGKSRALTVPRYLITIMA